MLLVSGPKQFPGEWSASAEARPRVRDSDAESFIYLVPNRVAQRRIERELLSAAEGRAVPALNVLTLADFARELTQVAFPDLRRIVDEEAAVLIEMSIRSLVDQRKLQFFERAGGSFDPKASAFPIPRGTFELVVNTIRQLKESGVIPADIAHDLTETRKRKGETTEVRRATDIHAIFEEYQRHLQKRFMDTYGQTLLLVERYVGLGGVGALGATGSIAVDFRARFPNVREMWMEGFYHLERPSIDLLRALSSVEQLTITIDLDLRDDNPDLFAGVSELRGKLMQAGFESQATRRTVNPASEHLAKHLFAYSGEPRGRVKEDSIEYWSAISPAEEIEEIARKIKLIAKDNQDAKADLSRIAIAMPNVENYTPLVFEVFRRHEIPVQIADRYHLDQSPLVLALIALLDMARHDIREKELVRAIGSPYFEFLTSGNELIDVQNLLEVLRAYKPSGDAAAWKKSLTAQIARIEREKEESLDPQLYARLEADQLHLQRAVSDLGELHAVTRSLNIESCPSEFCKKIRDMLQKLQLRNKLLANNRNTIGVGTLELDARAYRALLKLTEDLASLFHMMGIDDQSFPLGFYIDRLKAALTVARYNAKPVSGAVTVTSLAQSIGQTPDYLFIAGLIEGSLPSAYQPQVFLMDSMQKGERRQLLEERLLFYHAVTNYTKRLSLSWPRRTQSGGEMNRSNFVEALLEVVEIDEAQSAKGIFSYRDLYLNSCAWKQFEPAISEAFYAKTLEEHIPRTTRALDGRGKKDRSIYRGWIDPSLLSKTERDVLEHNKSRIWSVTQLEMYAGCPFRFFANYILNLGESGETDEGLDARDRGSALHNVLREFLTARREKRLPALQDLNDRELNVAYTDVQKIASAHFEKIANDHPFWRLDAERLLSDKQKESSVLWKFIKREKELQPFEPRPAFFEVSFGSPLKKGSEYDEELSRDEPVDINGVKLRGKIDRIDVTEDGDTFTIIDYKSGKTSASWTDIQRGLSLQLPLYLRAAEDLLRSHMPEVKGVAALYHKVLDSESKRELGLAVKSYAGIAFEKLRGRNGYVETPEELAEVIAATVSKAESYVSGIAEGDFRLTESDLVSRNCQYCSYQATCRVREAVDLDVL
jgi:ATP-dependent helicase/nuclease subunit B